MHALLTLTFNKTPNNPNHYLLFCVSFTREDLYHLRAMYILAGLFKEFRVVGQICREGMDESGILPKARYAVTIGQCLEQQGVWERCNPPVDPGQSFCGSPGG